MTVVDRTIARRARAAASAIVAVVAVMTAATAHGIAGGGFASLAAMATALVVAVPVGMIVVGQRVTVPRAAIGVVLDQAIFHAVFSIFGPAQPSTESAHHAHHGVALSLQAGPTATLDILPMVASHASAALIALVVLYAGRDAIARAVTEFTVAVRIALGLTTTTAPTPAARVRPTGIEHSVIPPVPAPLAHPRRGPPSLLVSGTHAP